MEETRKNHTIKHSGFNDCVAIFVVFFLCFSNIFTMVITSKPGPCVQEIPTTNHSNNAKPEINIKAGLDTNNGLLAQGYLFSPRTT